MCGMRSCAVVICETATHLKVANQSLGFINILNILHIEIFGTIVCYLTVPCILHSGSYHDSRGWALFLAASPRARVEHMSPHMRKRRG